MTVRDLGEGIGMLVLYTVGTVLSILFLSVSFWLFVRRL